MNTLGYTSVLLASWPSFYFQQTRLYQILIVNNCQSNHLSDSEITSKCLACLEWEKDRAINSNVKTLIILRILFMILNVQLTRVIPKSREIIPFHLGINRQICYYMDLPQNIPTRQHSLSFVLLLLFSVHLIRYICISKNCT